ncbi:MAG: hypothetical protein ACI9C4_000963 [Paraglaciecola sp.]
MTVLHTPNVRIRYTKIVTEGTEKNVIRGDWRSIGLEIGVFVDASLIGRGYRFSANFRTIRCSNNDVQNNYWNGSLDELGWGSWFWMSMGWDRARDAVRGDDGMFILRPYFVVDANVYGSNLYRPAGNSEFGVGSITSGSKPIRSRAYVPS